ncbi:MAG: YkvA family protein [Desulfovibrionales bacterium]
MKIPAGSLQDKLKQINSDYIRRGAGRITFQDLELITGKVREIKNKMGRSGSLSRYMDDVKLFLSLLRAYRTGAYREIPWWAISAIAFTLIYLLNPLDIIPDFIPVLGQIDDAMVIAVCLYMVEKELTKFKEWETSGQGTAPKEET